MLKRIAICFKVLALLLYLGTSVTWADPAMVIDNDDFSCVLLDGNGVVVVSEDVRIIATNNAPPKEELGNFVAICKADVTPSVDGTAVIYRSDEIPAPCFIIRGEETFPIEAEWQLTVSASGKATLVCRGNPSVID